MQVTGGSRAPRKPIVPSGPIMYQGTPEPEEDPYSGGLLSDIWAWLNSPAPSWTQTPTWAQSGVPGWINTVGTQLSNLPVDLAMTGEDIFTHGLTEEKLKAMGAGIVNRWKNPVEGFVHEPVPMALDVLAALGLAKPGLSKLDDMVTSARAPLDFSYVPKKAPDFTEPPFDEYADFGWGNVEGPVTYSKPAISAERQAAIEADTAAQIERLLKAQDEGSVTNPLGLFESPAIPGKETVPYAYEHPWDTHPDMLSLEGLRQARNLDFGGGEGGGLATRRLAQGIPRRSTLNPYEMGPEAFDQYITENMVAPRPFVDMWEGQENFLTLEELMRKQFPVAQPDLPRIPTKSGIPVYRGAGEPPGMEFNEYLYSHNLAPLHPKSPPVPRSLAETLKTQYEDWLLERQAAGLRTPWKAPDPELYPGAYEWPWKMEMTPDMWESAKPVTNLDEWKALRAKREQAIPGEELQPLPSGMDIKTFDELMDNLIMEMRTRQKPTISDLEAARYTWAEEDLSNPYSTTSLKNLMEEDVTATSKGGVNVMQGYSSDLRPPWGIPSKPAGTPITSFRGNSAFLSNFADSPITIEGITYPNAEAAFQAMKNESPAWRTRVSQASSPAEAKALGRRIALRPDWNDVRVSVMEDIVRAKFQQNPELARLLRATGDRPLIEGNTWGDTFWGQVQGQGQNQLGQILEKIRSEISEPRARPAMPLPEWAPKWDEPLPPNPAAGTGAADTALLPAFRRQKLMDPLAEPGVDYWGFPNPNEISPRYRYAWGEPSPELPEVFPTQAQRLSGETNPYWTSPDVAWYQKFDSPVYDPRLDWGNNLDLPEPQLPVGVAEPPNWRGRPITAEDVRYPSDLGNWYWPKWDWYARQGPEGVTAIDPEIAAFQETLRPLMESQMLKGHEVMTRPAQLAPNIEAFLQGLLRMLGGS